MSASAPASASTRTPRETAELMLRTVTEGSRDDLADLYAPDVRIVIPWAASAGVPRVTEGRESIRARMKAVESLWTFDSVQDVAIHETAADMVVVEYRINGTMSQSGKAFSLGYVSILTVRDGLIAEARDYNNTAETAELMKEFGSLGGEERPGEEQSAE